MLHQETNDYGVITVDNTFLSQLVRESLKPYEGKVWKANYKGKSSDFMIKLGNMDALAEQELRESEKGIYVKIYLIVRFGQSMSTIANKLINDIADTVINDLEAKIDNIEVMISGVMMKKGVVKRNLVYTYKKHAEEEQQ